MIIFILNDIVQPSQSVFRLISPKGVLMTSLKTLAWRERDASYFYFDETRRVLIPALCEIAHTIARGRKPNSCSLLPGVNLREWLTMVFRDEKDFLRDHVDEKCSYVVNLENTLWAYDDPNTQVIFRAISLCRRVLYPPRIPGEFRGDCQYQEAHKQTSLKRRRRWLAERNGSCYHGDYFDPFYG